MTARVMECDRRVVGESDFDYKERLDYNIRVPYDSYIEGRASFLCGKGKTFDGDDLEDVVEYLREECSEEIYDGVAIADKQICDSGYRTGNMFLTMGGCPLPFVYMPATEYVEDE